MKKQNQVFYMNKPERKKFVDYSPRFNVKNPQSAYHSGFKAQASAHMRRRRPQLKMFRLDSPRQAGDMTIVQRIHEQRRMLNEDQIRSSVMYRKLQDEISEHTKRQEEQLQKMRQLRNEKKNELQKMLKEEYETKLHIWELKNQVVELKESIEEQKSEAQRLVQELRTTEHIEENEEEMSSLMEQ